MSKLVAVCKRSRKAITGLVGGVIGWETLVSFAHISHAQWTGLAVVIATALGVYVAPNEPSK